jgi:dTMP kinase
MRGVLITFEGVEGSGKTTQMLRLERYLRKRRHKVERTKEPDGTILGMTIRHVFELPGFRPQPLTEAFLFMAARHQHVTDKVRPWLERGCIVLCDRYSDATVAYQGYGRGLDPNVIRELNVLATGGLSPDLTLVFDLPPDEGFRRIGRRVDLFEKRSLSFHKRVRHGYLEILKAEPKRVRLIDASGAPEDVSDQVFSVVTEFLRGA